MKSSAKQKRAPKDDEVSGVHAWLILWKAFRSVERRASESVESLGMGLSDFGVLETLLHKGPLPVNTIGKKVLLTSGSITTSIDRLEERGLVARSEHPTDRRARMVCLTSSGKKLIEKAFTRHAAQMEEVFLALTPPERFELVNLLKKLGQNQEAPAES